MAVRDQLTLDDARPRDDAVPAKQPRSRSQAKANGIHYTPVELAHFLAAGLARYAPAGDVLRVMDPACGDGELLAASAEQFAGQRNFELTGADIDATALETARARLAQIGQPVRLFERDFVASFGSIGSEAQDFEPFDAVISNPPYVRTQLLGGDRARALGQRFGLTGRVDLYQVFISVMAEHLAPGGVLALLCSNRFLSTQAGTSVREILRDSFEICEIVDLGDTKPFAAAVLPAIVFAQRRPTERRNSATFIRIYEQPELKTAPHVTSVVAAVAAGVEGSVEAKERIFRIERGLLKMGETSGDPWTLAHAQLAEWLAGVAAHTEQPLGKLAAIRVGIKTTADAVFIRSDWDDLAEDERPEAELLRPLITHHVTARWGVSREPTKLVLYPHTTGANGRQMPIELAEYPRAARYLESNRARLEGRQYVIAGGRRWYEIWVPQKPAEWPEDKIVFPDISDSPKFLLDRSQAIVNGDCYWISARTLEPEVVSLILAVTNSSFSMVFYDASCGNRLYAGRRRFITQYVRRFPIPKTSPGERAAIHKTVRALCDGTVDDPAATEQRLNETVWKLFGLDPEEVPW